MAEKNRYAFRKSSVVMRAVSKGFSWGGRAGDGILTSGSTVVTESLVSRLTQMSLPSVRFAIGTHQYG